MLICNAVLTDADGARPGDVRIENGVITAVGEGLSAGGDTVLDAGGRTLLPAFIDLHCHFRTPGFEYKEDIDSGSRAAARGGYTFVNCMANTRPVCSSAAIAQSIMDDARRIGLCDVNQCVSITKDFDGKTTGHLRALPRNIRFISEDGKGVRESRVMYEAMRIAAEKGLTVMSHAEDMDLSALDYRLAENLETARNLYLAQSTGAAAHVPRFHQRGAGRYPCRQGPGCARHLRGDAPPHLVLGQRFPREPAHSGKRGCRSAHRGHAAGRGGSHRDRPCPAHRGG